ncbi:DUF397 domain-containing protein [Lentzea aerocolonigenes]|uniref:DUF397 domain-containing protein n=1 Tax=Lentzea aerocolonigenes TaxID=68170 RepID=UPI0004C2C9C2|nr:DUF397 domain-containing protein [Lentzea aerocolonigenes]MCP2250152.1 protein of unknown function (DUF397) [Lentzea aerocolonigenes]
MTPERTWRKSTYSGDTASGSCVEVSLAAPVTPYALDSAAALVRDSKNTRGHVLAFSGSAWAAFVASVA